MESPGLPRERGRCRRNDRLHPGAGGRERRRILEISFDEFDAEMQELGTLAVIRGSPDQAAYGTSGLGQPPTDFKPQQSSRAYNERVHGDLLKAVCRNDSPGRQ